MTFTVFEHTADIGLEGEAGSLARLFEEAALAMFSLIVDLSGVRPESREELSLEAGDLCELMFVWLNELLFRLDSRGALVSEVSVKRVDRRGIEAVVAGEKLDPARHRLLSEVKAATYHEMTVEREGGTWKARIILDV